MDEHELLVRLVYRVLVSEHWMRQTEIFEAAYRAVESELKERIWELHEEIDDYNITDPHSRYLLGLPSSYKPAEISR